MLLEAVLEADCCCIEEEQYCCRLGGREFLRTEREALLAEAEADIRADDEAEAEAADAWDILFCADEDDDDEEDCLADCEDDDCVLLLLLLREAAVVIMGPGGPCIICMGCGGGENGQLLSKRLSEDARVLFVMGGGESGISTMGLGERVGIKSDCPLERKMPLRTGQGAFGLAMFLGVCVVSGFSLCCLLSLLLSASWRFSNFSICLNDTVLNESVSRILK